MQSGGVKIFEVGSALGFQGSNYEEARIYLNFVCGNCRANNCLHANLWENKLPRGYEEDLAKTTRPGVDKLLAELELPTAGRQRKHPCLSYGHGSYPDARFGARHGGSFGCG